MAQTPEPIFSPDAPTALGPYSHAIRVGDFVFASGQTGIDPKTGNLVGGLAEQTEMALTNLAAVLRSAGGSLDSVVKTTCFLTTMDHFAEMNAIYAKHFGDTKPARSTVAVAQLPKNGLFEIEAIAVISQ